MSLAARLPFLAVLATVAALWGCQQPEDTDIIAGTGGLTGSELPGTGGAGEFDAAPGGEDAQGSGGAAGGGSGGLAGGGPDASVDQGVIPDAGPTPDLAPVDLPIEMVVIPDGGPINPPLGYAGRPWNNTPQLIPGTIQCASFDVGGEGVAYHDTDLADLGVGFHGGPLTSFRPGESVDVAYTFAGFDRDAALVDIQVGQPYVGWTHAEEWLRYTVTVAETGRYAISALLSSIMDGAQVSFSFEDGATTGARGVPWTRGAHTWQVAQNIGSVNLTAGTHVLTLKFELVGAVNFEYLKFAREP